VPVSTTQQLRRWNATKFVVVDYEDGFHEATNNFSTELKHKSCLSARTFIASFSAPGLSAPCRLPTINAMKVDNLRSPYAKTAGLFYFARMLDKIRLHAAGQLPAEYHANLGGGFDERCLNFLAVNYDSLKERVSGGGTDEEILEWAYAHGRERSAEEIEVWNEFMRKRGWNDEATERLQSRLQEGGFADRDDVQTFFDFIDLDEGRREGSSKQ